MSKLFFDNLVSLEKIDREIKKIAKTEEEKNELWQIVDEMVHHRVFGCILGKLPKENHEEFFIRFHKAPYQEDLLEYLTQKIGQNVEELIKQEVGDLAFEILEEIQGKKSKK